MCVKLGAEKPSNVYRLLNMLKSHIYLLTTPQPRHQDINETQDYDY